MTAVKKIKVRLPIKACGPYVLIKPDKFEKTVGEGVLKDFVMATDGQAKREQYAQVKGTIVSIGQNAWEDYGNGEPWAQEGDRVYFKKHTQDQIFDEDDLDSEGKPTEYYLMQDVNVLALLED